MGTENTLAEISAEEIIVAEYGYIAQTAFQANEDRARVTTFYVVSVGSLMGALLGTNSSTNDITLFAFFGLFLFLSYFGIITIKQLIQLRKAWFESATAMNQIKDFVIKDNKELSQVFRWKTETLPNMYKPKSVAYLLAYQVAMLGAITFGAMIFYLGEIFANHFRTTTIILIMIAFGGGFFFLKYQMKFYRNELSKLKNTK